QLDREPAPVVVGRDARVDLDGDRDARAVANERLVDRVVDDLEDEMMKTALARVSDVHARALAHGLQPLEDLDVRGAVGGPGLGRAHGPPKSGFVTLPILPVGALRCHTELAKSTSIFSLLGAVPAPQIERLPRGSIGALGTSPDQSRIGITT